jgi:chemotaxis signal transduction protein
MVDLIVFNVSGNRFAINIDNVKRIIQARDLTVIPNSSPLIDGIMSYENNIIKVLSFRKLMGLSSYEEELSKFFEKIKGDHQSWVETLEEAIQNKTAFTKTTNPNECALGKWLNSFNSYEDKIMDIFKDLFQYHRDLHKTGGNALEVLKKDPLEAKRMFDEDVISIYRNTMNDLTKFTSEIDLISNSLQKLVIYETDEKIFAIKVDTIEDIAHIDESMIMSSDDNHHKNNNNLEILGIIEIDKVLVSVIKAVKLPL